MGTRGRQGSRQDRSRGVRFHQRHADSHRGRHQTPGVALARARRPGFVAIRERGTRSARRRPFGFHRAPRPRESHPQEIAHGPATVQRHRQRLLGRDSSPRELSPVKHTKRLTDEEIARLFDATRSVLLEWTDRLRKEYEGDFPTGVTAFREEMAVHGKFGKPCPVCGTPVQRIRYADNETNYCPRCQTDGRLLADRALSRLLREDWPRSIDEMTWT